MVYVSITYLIFHQTFQTAKPIPHTSRPGSAAKQTFLNMKGALKRRKAFCTIFHSTKMSTSLITRSLPSFDVVTLDTAGPIGRAV